MSLWFAECPVSRTVIGMARVFRQRLLLVFRFFVNIYLIIFLLFLFFILKKHPENLTIESGMEFMVCRAGECPVSRTVIGMARVFSRTVIDMARVFRQRLLLVFRFFVNILFENTTTGFFTFEQERE